MLWLAAYLTGFPPVGLHALRWTHGLAPMWSGLYLISTYRRKLWINLQNMCQCPLGLIPHFYEALLSTAKGSEYCVNALSGLYLISTIILSGLQRPLRKSVNALSGLYLISTRDWNPDQVLLNFSVNALSGLYLISTVSRTCESSIVTWCVNALSGLYLISTVPLQKPRFYAVSRACFCRYLSEYSDNSRFSCMLTFWTYLMRCTYP